jgi:hypothetical protein
MLMAKGKLMMNKKRQFLTLIYYRPTSTKRKPNLPVRSFSLCSLLPGYKRRGNWKASTHEDRKEKNDAREIDKFEKDFLLPMWKQETSVSKRLSKNHIFNGSLKMSIKEMFHSSSDSIPTDIDSGAFSVLEYSDFSDSLISVENPLLQLYGNNIEKSPKKEPKQAQPKTPDMSAHKTTDCEGIVTVNGLCYQCM